MKNKELEKKIESYTRYLGVDEEPRVSLIVRYAIRYGYNLAKKEFKMK